MNPSKWRASAVPPFRPSKKLLDVAAYGTAWAKAAIGGPHLMLTQFIAAVPAKELRKPLLSLDARSDDIMRALDMLLIKFWAEQAFRAGCVPVGRRST